MLVTVRPYQVIVQLRFGKIGKTYTIVCSAGRPMVPYPQFELHIASLLGGKLIRMLHNRSSR